MDKETLRSLRRPGWLRSVAHPPSEINLRTDFPHSQKLWCPKRTASVSQFQCRNPGFVVKFHTFWWSPRESPVSTDNIDTAIRNCIEVTIRSSSAIYILINNKLFTKSSLYNPYTWKLILNPFLKVLLQFLTKQ